MADYRILCVEREEDAIVAVGTGGDDGVAHRRWLVAEVRRAIQEGDYFYVVGGEANEEVPIDIRDGVLGISPEQVAAADVKDLRECRWY